MSSNLSLKHLLFKLKEEGLDYSRPWLEKKIRQGDIVLPKRAWNKRYNLDWPLIDRAVKSIKETGEFHYEG